MLRALMLDLAEKSLALHRQHHGKISVVPTVPITNSEELSLAYTPGVAAACQAIAADSAAADTLTIKRRTVAIITDGTAVLGLGNIGPLAALPVMEGKAALFKQLADVDAFPICLNTQDTEEIIATIKNIAPVFGGINLEDISAPRCFTIESRLRAELDIPVIHDDQWGTATVVLAGLINALQVRQSAPAAVKVVVNGAGAAGTAIIQLLLAYGFKHIIACDTHGVIYDHRPDLTDAKAELAHITNLACRIDRADPACIMGTVADALVGADIFIGVSKGNLITPEMIKTMAARPIIFALANPTPEIMPDVATAAGAFIVASGRSDFPNQVNNVLAFPGLLKGALISRQQFNQAMFVRAAEALAKCIAHPVAEKILPTPFDPGVAAAVAKGITSY